MNDGKEFNFDNRDPVSGVDRLFVERWSPRAFQKQALQAGVLQRIVDAARWSPSCYNEQPWCIHTSTDDTFDEYLSLLLEGNQSWAKNASVLGFFTGRINFARNGKANNVFAFDCGAAWMALSLQARIEGFYTHGMAGIDYHRVAEYFQLDANEERVLMGFALGKIGHKSQLKEELQQKENPSARKSLQDIWRQGRD